jgi:maleylpyruvate isomerase
MNELSPKPEADLGRVAAAQARLMATLRVLVDDDTRRPSALPGWSVGHVLTHIARNADSHRRRAEAAAKQQLIEQYTGGYAGRAQEIEMGAGRNRADLVYDVRRTADQLQSTWEGLPQDAWRFPTRDVAGRERPLNVLPRRRWQELEIHVIDLKLGPTHRDWSDEFVEQWLPRLRLELPGRLPTGVRPPTTLDERDELAWLFGRLDGPDLPKLAPWG